MNYQQRIKELRKEQGKTQQEIADILNTERGYYNKYEKGKHPLPIEHLITLTKYYNVTADYILGISDKKR